MISYQVQKNPVSFQRPAVEPNPERPLAIRAGPCYLHYLQLGSFPRRAKTNAAAVPGFVSLFSTQ